jgi:hypothetical protein
LPGEEAVLTITFSTKDGEIGSPAGQFGEYEIVLFFRRPDAAIASTNFSFDMDQHSGSSLLAIANPALKFNDPRFDVADTKIKLYVSVGGGLSAEAFGFPNKDGYLSDLRITLQCDSFADASKKTILLFTPMISAISFSSDIPLIMSHSIIREKATAVMQRTVIAPFPVSQVSLLPHAQTPEARVLLNRYRDGLSSNDPSWRFLCFASILEQLWKRNQTEKKHGSPDLEAIQIPEGNGEIVAWFSAAFPGTHKLRDDLVLDSVPTEARGITTNQVIVNYIRPLRKAIAHSLIEDGTLPSEANEVDHLLEVRKWLPILRCITRYHLRAIIDLPEVSR